MTHQNCRFKTCSSKPNVNDKLADQIQIISVVSFTLLTIKNCILQLIMSAQGVQWHFNPPAAPWMGGAWERLIQSAKSALQGVLHGRTLTDEVLLTAMVEVEEILNNLPLTYLSVEPTDLQPVTPNHLLFGQACPSMPFDVENESEVDSRKRVKQAQAIATSFNRRWRNEYFPHLLERRKWLLPRRNLKVGDLVLIVTSNVCRDEWPRGRVQWPSCASSKRNSQKKKPKRNPLQRKIQPSKAFHVFPDRKWAGDVTNRISLLLNSRYLYIMFSLSFPLFAFTAYFLSPWQLN